MSSENVYPLKLRYNFAGMNGPGISELLIEKSGLGAAVRFCSDVNAHLDGERYIWHMLLPDPTEWRPVIFGIENENVDALATDGLVDEFYPWPHKMTFEGPHNLGTEMIALAWAGEPLLSIVKILLTFDDKTLAAFRKRSGSLVAEETAKQLHYVWDACDELGVSFERLLSDIPAEEFSIDAIVTAYINASMKTGGN